MQVETNRKFDMIEKEIDSLKAMIVKLSQNKKRNNIIKLEGALKGISVTEKEIGDAKKSLFKAGS